LVLNVLEFSHDERDLTAVLHQVQSDESVVKLIDSIRNALYFRFEARDSVDNLLQLLTVIVQSILNLAHLCRCRPEVIQAGYPGREASDSVGDLIDAAVT
jgi:hypothetical protein